MNSKIVLPLALAAAMPFANISRADTYTETGDAGDMPATAQVVSSPTLATPLTSITGNLTPTNEIADSDMYEIYISNPAGFSAANTAFAVGANNFDSQIELFNAAGVGVEDNDDTAAGGSDSSLPTGNALLSAQGVGYYYLLISGSGRYAVDGSNNLIFPNYTDGTTDPTGVYGPNATAGAIAGYTGASNEAGKYIITLTGAQFVFNPVPEPSAYDWLLAGGIGLCVVLRARRTSVG